jgi:hypothetical protein
MKIRRDEDAARPNETAPPCEGGKLCRDGRRFRAEEDPQPAIEDFA